MHIRLRKLVTGAFVILTAIGSTAMAPMVAYADDDPTIVLDYSAKDKMTQYDTGCGSMVSKSVVVDGEDIKPGAPIRISEKLSHVNNLRKDDEKASPFNKDTIDNTNGNPLLLLPVDSKTIDESDSWNDQNNPYHPYTSCGRLGFTITGWSSDDGKYDNVSSIPIAEIRKSNGVKLHAVYKWDNLPYTVVIDSNDKTNRKLKFTVDKGDDYNFSDIIRNYWTNGASGHFQPGEAYYDPALYIKGFSKHKKSRYPDKSYVSIEPVCYAGDEPPYDSGPCDDRMGDVNATAENVTWYAQYETDKDNSTGIPVLTNTSQKLFEGLSDFLNGIIARFVFVGLVITFIVLLIVIIMSIIRKLKAKRRIRRMQ